MEFIECVQGTPEWMAARAGLCTASEFSVAVSTTGGLDDRQQKYVDAVLKLKMTESAAMAYAGYKAAPRSESVQLALRGELVEEMSDQALRYAHDLAMERISGMPYGIPPKTWLLQRGHEREEVARRKYQARTGAFMTRAGLCVDGLFGYSSDGLIEDDGLWECKAPIDSVKIAHIWRTGDLSEYMHQLQGGLWLTGRKWIDYSLECEALEKAKKDLYIKRIERDEEFIDAMVLNLERFQNKVSEIVAFFMMAKAA